MSGSLKTMLQSQISQNNWLLVRAFKFARIESNLRFLRSCKSNNLLPHGFRVKNKIRDTLFKYSRESQELTTKQSRQWLICAINALYVQRNVLSCSPIYPLTRTEFSILSRYRFLLRTVKRSKFQHLLRERGVLSTTSPSPPPDGFCNKSQAIFTPIELSILKKGPSYVPPPPQDTLNTVMKQKAEIQACLDRVEYKDPLLSLSHCFVEFLSGTVRICQQSTNDLQSQQNKNIASAVKNIKKKAIDAPILPTDKTKRLMALDKPTYDNLLCSALNSEDPIVRSVLPVTSQNRFNSSIRNIANNYPVGSLSSAILHCKSSEPLPSHPYALPKDHKPGQLKARPIISTCSSVVKNLAIFFCKLLNPLVQDFVDAHLKSTDDFVQWLSSINAPNGTKMVSFDVSNLYGSIPLTSTSTAPGLIEVTTSFFDRHAAASSQPDLKPVDFKRLLELCLFEDCYTLNGQCRKQSKGIAMGNPAAPPLAIIYLNNLEEILLPQCSSIIHWKRYIDDVWSLIEGDSQSVLQYINSLNPFIQFTVENSINDSISFLDTSVSLNNGHFNTTLFIKPTHSGTCLPFSACVPNSRKINLIRSESHRCRVISSADNTIPNIACSSLIPVLKAMVTHRSLSQNLADLFRALPMQKSQSPS